MVTAQYTRHIVLEKTNALEVNRKAHSLRGLMVVRVCSSSLSIMSTFLTQANGVKMLIVENESPKTRRRKPSPDLTIWVRGFASYLKLLSSNK